MESNVTAEKTLICIALSEVANLYARRAGAAAVFHEA